MSIFVIRHGDRQDYADREAWYQQAKAAGGNVRDPPLSRLGRKQAHETGVFMAKLLAQRNVAPENVVILASPYLRTIQTAQPTSDALGLPIHLEHGLAESHFVAADMRKPRHDHTRWLAFPQVDVEYKNMWDADSTPGYAADFTEQESFPVDYYRRLTAFAHRLEASLQPGGHLHGKTVLCFSHAASTALIAALRRDHDNLEGYKFAPCGIYHLRVDSEGVGGSGGGGGGGDGISWRLHIDGSTNAPHVSENSPTTFPWGFPAEDGGLFCEMWHTELKLLRDAALSRRQQQQQLEQADGPVQSSSLPGAHGAAAVPTSPASTTGANTSTADNAAASSTGECA